MKTIAWDIDDVLNELMRMWFQKKWVIEHPRVHLRYGQIIENPPHKLLGVSKEEYLASLDEFRQSFQYRKMQPNPLVKNWFMRYGKFFRHIAITAVPVHVANISAEWLLRHFGTWIRTFHFVPPLRRGLSVPRYDNNKNDFLLRLDRVDIFIDDNEENMRMSKEAGIKGILFPRPWNSSKLTVGETLEILAKISP